MKAVLDVVEIVPPYGSLGTVKYLVRANGEQLCVCDKNLTAQMIARALKFYGDHLISENDLRGS